MELKGRAMGSNASATRDAPNLSDLGGKEPAARALTAIFSELSEVGGRSLRNEATHSLSQVGGPHALLDLDVRTIRADIEVARGARLLDTIQLKGVRLGAGISWKPRASQPGEFLSTPSASS